MREKGRALTLRHPGILRVIKTQCSVCAAFNPATTPKEKWNPFIHTFEGIWDTGASSSVITQHVVDTLGLKPTGMTLVNHAGGQEYQETYLVNIALPSEIAFHSLPVTKAPLTGTHLLIGMDIITGGDFTITNKGSETIFTFRVPSSARTDYVKEEDRLTSGAGPSPGASFHGKKRR